jgi:hypothetical protein
VTGWEEHRAAHARITATEWSRTVYGMPAYMQARKAVEERQAELASLAETVVAQEANIREAAAAVRAPVNLTDLYTGPAASGLPWPEAVADLRARLGTAHTATGELYRLGHRARLFPGLSQTARAVAIFLLCSLPVAAVNIGLAMYVAGTDAERTAAGTLPLCSALVLPFFAAAGAAALTVTVGRPRIHFATNVWPGLAVGALLCFVVSIVSLCLAQPVTLLVTAGA